MMKWGFALVTLFALWGVSHQTPELGSRTGPSLGVRPGLFDWWFTNSPKTTTPTRPTTEPTEHTVPTTAPSSQGYSCSGSGEAEKQLMAKIESKLLELRESTDISINLCFELLPTRGTVGNLEDCTTLLMGKEGKKLLPMVKNIFAKLTELTSRIEFTSEHC